MKSLEDDDLQHFKCVLISEKMLVKRVAYYDGENIYFKFQEDGEIGGSFHVYNVKDKKIIGLYLYPLNFNTLIALTSKSQTIFLR